MPIELEEVDSDGNKNYKEVYVKISPQTTPAVEPVNENDDGTKETQSISLHDGNSKDCESGGLKYNIP